MSQPDSVLAAIASFARGSTEPSEFEQWLYRTPAAEARLGADLFLDVLSIDYRDPGAVSEARSRLRGWCIATASGPCICLLWPDSYQCVFGSETYRYIPEQFAVLRERNSWVRLVTCRGCGQPWYTATDTVDDEWHFVRLSKPQVAAVLDHGVWPEHFVNLVNVWQ